MTELAPTHAAVPFNDLQPPSMRLIRAKRGGKLTADLALRGVTAAAATTILLMLAALLVILFVAALPTIKAYGFSFLTSDKWQPNERTVTLRGPDGKLLRGADGKFVKEVVPPKFGALPVIYGTAMSSVIALVIAVPLSFGAAVFLVRIAPRSLIAPVSFLIEFLAAIPSIAYGIWGLFVLVPFMRDRVEPFLRDALGGVYGLGWMFTDDKGRDVKFTGFDLLTGGTVLGIMILPIITAISRDVLRGVPRAQVEGTTALGATWWQSSVEMLRYSRSALFGAVMLGLARAAGETMAVTVVIGNAFQVNASPFQPAQTMSSLLANKFAEATNELELSALIEVALLLLLMSLVFNVVARYLVVGKQSRSAAAH